MDWAETTQALRTMNRLEEKIEDIDARLEKMEEKIDLLVSKLTEIDKDTTSMGKHVEFVEGIYQQVRRPFHFLMGAVEQVSRLRVIKDDEEEPKRIVFGRSVEI